MSKLYLIITTIENLFYVTMLFDNAHVVETPKKHFLRYILKYRRAYIFIPIGTIRSSMLLT